MKHLIKDFFNFGRKRTHKEAAIFLIFHSSLILIVMSVLDLMA